MNRQKHKLSRRILAMLLTAAILVTMFPAAMFAAPTTGGLPSNIDWSPSKSKTATALDDNFEADVTLSLPAADYERNIDVVILMDDTHATSSIFTDAANNLLNQLANKENLNISVGIVAFDAVARDWVDATSDSYSGLVSLKDENGEKDEEAVKALQNAIETQLSSDKEGTQKRIGGTNTEWPIALATEMLDGRNSEKYIVMFSDLFGYVYRGDMTVNDVTYENVPMSKRLEGQELGYLCNGLTKYDSWDELYEHKNEAADTSEDSFYRMYEPYWSNYWDIYYSGENGKPELSKTLEQSPAYPQYKDGTLESYQVFTPFEKSSCLTYDNIMFALEEKINVILVNNDYDLVDDDSYNDCTRTLKNGMLDALSDIEGVTVIKEVTENSKAFSEEQVEHIFDVLNNTLIQVVDAGSYVVDEMGSGQDNYGNAYDFAFVNDIDRITLTVGEEQLKATEITEPENGATSAWSFGENGRFKLYYFADGTTYQEQSYDECFIWEINEPVTKDNPVQLTYAVKLTNPQTAKTTEIKYTGLKTNNTTDLYYKDSEGNEGGPEPFVSPEVEYTVQAQGVVTITPADITIYMGGNDGYEAVVGEDSAAPAISVNSLPSPLFLIESGIDGFDPTQLVFSNIANGNKGWTAEKVGAVSNEPNARGLYRLVPTGENQDAVRVQYTDGDTAVVSDEFDPTTEQELYKQYGIEMYYGSNNPEDIVATYNGTTYGIKMETGTLTVRAVDNTENTPETNPVHGITTGDTGKSVALVNNAPAAITAPAGTTYTLNETTVSVDAAGVGLLFDGIINDDAHQRTGALIDKVDATMGGDSSNRKYQAQYLDLVDENNGNAWVKASGDVTITWAYPEDTGENTEFTLYHFEGLHRDGTNSGFEISDVNGITPEKIDIDTDENGITFTVGSGGFSPFVLVWEEADDDNPPYIPPTTGDDDDDEEDPDTPALDKVNHFLYVEGYPEDYRTGEYSDNEDLWPVKPQGNITRAEVATIFYRLLKDEVREEIETDVNSFPDVNEDDWFNVTVSSLANMGAISGYEDGAFRPNEPISRAELAAMAVRFYDTFEAEYEEGTFLDVDGDEWYADAIAAAEELGIIGGYPDGTVRPNNNITRAETCAIVNRVLERRPHDEHLGDVDDMRTWPDNQPGAWYYADMQEATNGHYYEWIDIDGSKFEEWTEVDKDYDWTKR